MEVHAISTPYMSGKVYVIFEIPHDKINGFEVYRDGKMIATSFSEKGLKTFISPTMFDRDYHTNLFRKDSKYRLMYEDNNVYKYQHYEYQVIAIRTNENDEIMERIESDIVCIEAQ